MKIVDLKQNTPEWLAWRLEGIGASDAPILLGVSKYKTAWELWAEKVGIVPINPDSQAFQMAKGHEEESKARAYYELMNDLDCPATCGEDEQYPFLKASLDGYNAKEAFGLEIKYVGKDAMGTEILPAHWIQVQHQIMVFNLKDVVFLRANSSVTNIPKKDLIERDDKFIAYLLDRECEFWEMVEQNVAPIKFEKERKRKTKSGKGA